MSIGRRGFFQMVGPGAVGSMASLASIPLFSTGSPVLEPGNLLAGHLVVERAFVEGVAYALVGGDDPRAGIMFRSKSDGGLVMAPGVPAVIAPWPSERASKDGWVARTTKHELDSTPRAVVISSSRLAVTRDRVLLEPSDRYMKADHGEYANSRVLADVELAGGADPLLRFYEIAQRLRERIRDEAVRALENWPEGTRHGIQIVTVVESPLAGHVVPSEQHGPPRLIVTANYEHWLVQGTVETVGVYSSAGEYPLDDELDVERLVWIDERVRSGKIILPGTLGTTV